MKYRFELTQLRPDLKEDLYRLDVKAEGESIYEEAWYLRRIDLELLGMKIAKELQVEFNPTLIKEKKT